MFKWILQSKRKFQILTSNYVKLAEHVYRHVKTDLSIFSMMGIIRLTVKSIRIPVSAADTALGYVLPMQSNMVNCFLRLLREEKQLSLIRISVSAV